MHSPVSHDTEIWQSVLEVLREKLPLPTIEIWLQPLQISQINMTENAIVLASPSGFNQSWVKKNCLQHIQQAFLAVLSFAEAPNVEIIVYTDCDTDDKLSLLELDAPIASFSLQPAPKQEALRPSGKPSPYAQLEGLNPRYRFNNFVVGEHNRFAHAAAIAVANAPGESYNPLFLYGGVGLGKTHLMQAIGHHIYSKTPDLKIRYATTEQFTNELIQAIAAKTMKQFRERFRRNDVLIMDDIQFLEGKDRTQEELFHTFNALHEAGKQIILSSDRPPERLSRLEDRLRSRFACGLITDIQRPDYETRVAILQHKSSVLKLALPEDVVQYIADSFPANIRELEGALNKLSAFKMLSGSDALNLDAVKSLIGRRFDISRLTLDDMLDHVARYYKVQSSDLKSPLRSKYISNIRQIAIYVLRELTDTSFPQLGHLFGGRKHSTILYSYEKLKEAVANDSNLDQQLREVMSTIKQSTQI